MLVLNTRILCYTSVEWLFYFDFIFHDMNTSREDETMILSGQTSKLIIIQITYERYSINT